MNPESMAAAVGGGGVVIFHFVVPYWEVIQGNKNERKKERKKGLLLAEGLCGLCRNGNQFTKIKSNIGVLWSSIELALLLASSWVLGLKVLVKYSIYVLEILVPST